MQADDESSRVATRDGRFAPGPQPKRRATGRFRTSPIALALASFLTTFLIAAAGAELVVLPRIFGVPRELALLGLIAHAERVDDTTINSIGFTGDVPSLQKPPRLRRILTLGGSSLFNRRMTERFKRQISERAAQPVEVLGAALRMHTSRASVIKYRFLAKYRFDVVLIYDGINDLWANHVRADQFRADYSHLNPWYRRSFLLDHSLIARVLYNRLAAGRTQAIEDFLAGKPAAVINGADFRSAATMENNLRQLVRMVRRDGGVPVLMTFAWNIPSNYSYAAFESGALGYVNPDHYDATAVEVWGPVPFVREALRRQNEAVLQVARDESVDLVDLQTLLDNRIELFGDVCHLNDVGSDELVRQVVDHLAQRGLI